MLAACGSETGSEREEDAAAPAGSGIGSAAESVRQAGVAAARDAVKAAEPERPSQLIEISGTDGAWGGLLTQDRFYYRSGTHAGWYASPYSATITSGMRELRLREGQSTLRIIPGACGDEGLLPEHPDRVAFAHDGAAQTGCAGPATFPQDMAGTTWLVVRLGEEEAPLGSHPVTTIYFGEDQRLGGSLSCNDAGVSGFEWTEDGGFRRIGEVQEIAVTEMHCSDEAADEFGNAVYDRLTEAEGWTRNGGRLTITLPGNEEMEALYLERR